MNRIEKGMKTMKKSLISKTAGVLALLLMAGCRVATPTPAPDDNTRPLPKPFLYYGDIELFDEKITPLAAMITTTAASDEISLAETLKNSLNRSNIICVSPGSPYDIQISINSAYQDLTPVPQCRLSHILSISAAAADGRTLLPVWKHKTEVNQAYKTSVEAKSKLRPAINESIDLWVGSRFGGEVKNVLRVSVMRFKMPRKLIELDPVYFEKELRTVSNKLRRIDGVIDVRIIEADRVNRIASFRVLYRGNGLLRDIIKKQK